MEGVGIVLVEGLGKALKRSVDDTLLLGEVSGLLGSGSLDFFRWWDLGFGFPLVCLGRAH